MSYNGGSSGSDDWKIDRRWVMETVSDNRTRLNVIEKNLTGILIELKAIEAKVGTLVSLKEKEIEQLTKSAGSDKKVFRDIIIAPVSAISAVGVSLVSGLGDFIK